MIRPEPESTDELQRRAYLDMVQTELLDVLKRHTATMGIRNAMQCLAELLGSVAQLANRMDKSARSDFAAMIEALRLAIDPPNERPH